jgi:hypothetical protein
MHSRHIHVFIRPLLHPEVITLQKFQIQIKTSKLYSDQLNSPILRLSPSTPANIMRIFLAADPYGYSCFEAVAAHLMDHHPTIQESLKEIEGLDYSTPPKKHIPSED